MYSKGRRTKVKRKRSKAGRIIELWGPHQQGLILPGGIRNIIELLWTQSVNCIKVLDKDEYKSIREMEIGKPY